MGRKICEENFCKWCLNLRSKRRRYLKFKGLQRVFNKNRLNPKKNTQVFNTAGKMIEAMFASTYMHDESAVYSYYYICEFKVNLHPVNQWT